MTIQPSSEQRMFVADLVECVLRHVSPTTIGPSQVALALAANVANAIMLKELTDGASPVDVIEIALAAINIRIDHYGLHMKRPTVCAAEMTRAWQNSRGLPVEVG